MANVRGAAWRLAIFLTVCLLGAFALLGQDSNQNLFADGGGDPHFSNCSLLDDGARGPVCDRPQARGSKDHQNPQQQNDLGTQRHPSAVRFDSAGLGFSKPATRKTPRRLLLRV